MNPRIYLLALGTFAIGAGTFVIAGILPTIAHTLRVSVNTAGQLVTLFSLTYGLGSPFLAALTSSMPRRLLLLTSLLVFSVANLLSALSPTFGWLMLTRILAAGCAALFAPTAYTAAASLAPPLRRGQALAVVVAGLTMSTVLGVPLGTWVGQRFGWPMTFNLVALIAGFAVLVLFLCGLPQIDNAPPISLQARLAPIGQPRILLALFPIVLWTIGVFAVYTYITPLLQQNLPASDISALLLIYGLGGLVGNWLGGYSVDRFGSIRPLAGGILVLAISMVVLPFANSSIIGASVDLFIWGAAGWALFPPQQYRLLNLAPENTGVILALNNSALYLGVAAGAALGGLLLHYIPIAALSWVGGGFVFLALPVLFISTRTASIPAIPLEPVSTKTS